MQVVSTNIAVPHDHSVRRYPTTGIDKHPVDALEVAAPGPNYGDGSGVSGDFVGDSDFHGGAHKAVYAYAREELDYWEGKLGCPLRNGSFGDNLTTSGVVLRDLLINQQVRVGSALLQVSVPRTPCGTFAEWLGERGWVKTWSDRGDCGAYFRVLEPGRIAPGDALEFVGRPDHDVTMGMAFRAKLGDVDLARHVVEVHCLPDIHHLPMAKRVEVADKHAKLRVSRGTSHSE